MFGFYGNDYDRLLCSRRHGLGMAVPDDSPER